MNRALRRRYGHALDASDRERLERLRAERAALIATYGPKGQKHPMTRQIGGLNPAASRLFVLRGEIARLEKQAGPAARPMVACDACSNWHPKGKHTASTDERRATCAKLGIKASEAERVIGKP